MSVENREPVGDSEEARRGRGCLGTALIVLGALVLLFGSLVGVFFWNNRPVHIDIPTPKMPRPNAWDDFTRAGKLTRVFGPYSTIKPPTAWTEPELERFMRSDAAALTMLRRGLKKPYRHPLQRGLPKLQMPPYPVLRELGRTLAGAAYYYETRGQIGDAVDARLDCVELGVTVPRGGNLVPALVGLAIEDMGTERIERWLPRLTRAELAHCAARLRVIRSKRVSFASTMAEEGDSLASMLVEMSRDPRLVRDVRDPRRWLKIDRTLGLHSKKGGTWDNISFAFGNKTRMIQEIRYYYTKVGVEQNRAYTGKPRTPKPTSYLAEISLMDLSRVRLPFASREAVFALIGVEIALRRYHADHGRYPARLKQLRLAYLKSIPYDPFGGKALRYRVLKSGQDFLLYSVGPDLRDNRGKGAQRLALGQGGDIVLERK